MRSKIIRVSCSILLLFVVASQLLALSWWMTLFFAFAAILIFLAKRYDKKEAGVVFWLLIVGSLAALHYFGVLPSQARNTSCEAGIVERLKRKLESISEPIVKSASAEALAARRILLARDASRLLYGGAQAVEIDRLQTSVGRILELPSAPGLEGARKEVSERSNSINSFLNEKQLVGKESRSTLYKDFETQIKEVVEKGKTAGADEIDGLQTRLFEIDTPSDLSNLARQMFSLQESLIALTRQSVDATPRYMMSWSDDPEGSGVAVYREDITITSRQDAPIDELDASLLAREAEAGKTPYKLRLKRESGLEDVSDPARILIHPAAKQVVLQYDRILPLDATPYCSAPIHTIERLRFVWPTSSSSLRLGGVLASGDIRLPVWFALDRSKADSQLVEEIALPRYSFFASREEFQQSTQDGHDVLRDSKSIAVASFAQDKDNWIEVFQRSAILRWFLVARYREYLVFENAASAAIAVLVGGIIAFIFPERSKANARSLR